MPWTAKQHRLFEAIAHGAKPTTAAGARLSQADAAKMASEGVKRKGQQKALRAMEKA